MKKIMVLYYNDTTMLDILLAANELGYYVILCHNSYPDNLSEKARVDTFYEVDLNDVERLCEIAVSERIDGVISATDAAMHTVNEIAARLGLMGNSVEGIDKLLTKDGLRIVQKKLGLTCPEFYTAETEEAFLEKARRMHYPVIIKANQSSGSDGTRRFDTFDEKAMKASFAACKNASRNGLVNIEGFETAKDAGRLLDINIFVLGKEIIWNGIRYSYRNANHPLATSHYIYSADDLTDAEMERIRHDVSAVMDECGIVFGQLDLDCFFTEQGEFFIVEINPRQGGNYMSRGFLYQCGINFSKLLVSTCVRDYSYYEALKSYVPYRKYIGLMLLRSDKNGVYRGIHVEDCLKPYFMGAIEMIGSGAVVKARHNLAHGQVAYCFFDFGSKEVQDRFERSLHQYVSVEVGLTAFISFAMKLRSFIPYRVAEKLQPLKKLLFG